MAKHVFTKKGISNLPNNKPVKYVILTKSGKTNYVGIAKRGRAQDRLAEHLGQIPGATVQIEQYSSIDEAKKKEKLIINREKPKYNKQS